MRGHLQLFRESPKNCRDLPLAGCSATQTTTGHPATVSDSRYVEDLPGHVLAAAAGNVIHLDSNAAGFGWFIDPTPDDDLEFNELLAPDTLHGQDATDHMDLLTAVMHEMGHIVGLDDSDHPGTALL